jgi:hypothetical protein
MRVLHGESSRAAHGRICNALDSAMPVKVSRQDADERGSVSGHSSKIPAYSRILAACSGFFAATKRFGAGLLQ